MKVLAFFALSAVATAAMAVQPPSTITLNGPSVQMTNSVGTAITNTSGARNEALQNIASNAGPVQVFAGGSSTQTANLGLGAVTNEAKGEDALARQNLASNNYMANITSEGMVAAAVTLSIIPIVALYPFVARFMVQGITIGSVKG